MSNHKTDVDPRSGKGIERICFFSDAVFAIVMTLLILDLKALEVSTESSILDIMSQLASRGVQLIAFVSVFLLLGYYWMCHHDYFNCIEVYDRKLLWKNLFFLLSIAFMPFTFSAVWYTEAIGETSMNQVVVLALLGLCWLNLLISRILLNAIWTYAAKERYLLKDNVALTTLALYRYEMIFFIAGLAWGAGGGLVFAIFSFLFLPMVNQLSINDSDPSYAAYIGNAAVAYITVGVSAYVFVNSERKAIRAMDKLIQSTQEIIDDLYSSLSHIEDKISLLDDAEATPYIAETRRVEHELAKIEDAAIWDSRWVERATPRLEKIIEEVTQLAHQLNGSPPKINSSRVASRISSQYLGSISLIRTLVDTLRFWRALFIRPTTFFANLRQEDDLLKPTVFALICSVISGTVFVFAELDYPDVRDTIVSDGIVAVLFGGWVTVAVVLAILIGIVHLFVWLFARSRNLGIKTTYQVVCYTSFVLVGFWTGVGLAPQQDFTGLSWDCLCLSGRAISILMYGSFFGWLGLLYWSLRELYKGVS